MTRNAYQQMHDELIKTRRAVLLTLAAFILAGLILTACGGPTTNPTAAQATADYGRQKWTAQMTAIAGDK